MFGRRFVAACCAEVLSEPTIEFYGEDRAIDPELQRFMAQRAQSTTVQFDEASHVGGLTHYAARFVKLIERAIDAAAT